MGDLKPMELDPAEIGDLLRAIKANSNAPKAPPLSVVETTGLDRLGKPTCAALEIRGRCPHCCGGWTWEMDAGVSRTRRCPRCHGTRAHVDRFNAARLPLEAHRVEREWREDIAPAGLARELAESLRSGGRGRIWWGAQGRGKTRRALAVALHFLRLGGSVRWVSWAPLMYQLQEAATHSKRNGEEPPSVASQVGGLLDAGLLVVDDIGDRVTPFRAELAEMLLGMRCDLRRPMVVTTNLDPRQLGATLGARVMSRMGAACALSEVTGIDLRGVA